MMKNMIPHHRNQPLNPPKNRKRKRPKKRIMMMLNIHYVSIMGQMRKDLSEKKIQICLM